MSFNFFSPSSKGSHWSLILLRHFIGKGDMKKRDLMEEANKA